MQNAIRNFVIIAHIDHGKSTLADRLLEVTGTVPMRSMHPQYLDALELERERGITIKMAPVRMMYHANRGLTQTDSRIDADNGKLLFEELSYNIRGAAFAVKKNLGLGHKEVIYQKAFAEELRGRGMRFEAEKSIDLFYGDEKLGIYRPDFIVEDKILVELKALPFIGQTEEKQIWSYLKGSSYKLALLINFGGSDVAIKRVVYDTARDPRAPVPTSAMSASSPRESALVEVEYTLNLIDTPGHSDFGYEVSRALMAVEGAVLLVDATQGIQAQTLANFEHAKRAGLTIIGAVNKIDIAAPERVAFAREELADLLGVAPADILGVSGKTGAGVPELLEAIVERIPPPGDAEVRGLDADQRGDVQRQSALSPRESALPSRALIFDSQYDEHRGVIAYVRVFSGAFRMLDHEEAPYYLAATHGSFKPKEIGYFAPQLKSCAELREGEIGYIATGIKDPNQLKIGDTIFSLPDTASAKSAFSPRESASWALPGFKIPKPVVFVSFYPAENDDYDHLKAALGKLRLNDSSLAFLPDKNEVLGRGFKGGFLGRLHFEITAERLAREFGIETVHSFPSVAYRVRVRPRTNADVTQTNADNFSAESAFSQRDSAWIVVNNPKDFPDDNLGVEEPVCATEVLLPSEYLGPVLQLTQLFRFRDIETKNFGSRIIVAAKLPLADLIQDLDDQLKSVTQGFASLSYELTGYEPAVVKKMDILVAENPVAGLTRILPAKDIEREARKTVERLKELLPRQQFVQALQAIVAGRIIARETIPALKKELGNFGKNGGDRTRKMKLWKKQQRGKERLKERAESSNIRIPAHIFKELLKK